MKLKLFPALPLLIILGGAFGFVILLLTAEPPQPRIERVWDSCISMNFSRTTVDQGGGRTYTHYNAERIYGCVRDAGFEVRGWLIFNRYVNQCINASRRYETNRHLNCLREYGVRFVEV
jgi:hypothetical protein